MSRLAERVVLGAGLCASALMLASVIGDLLAFGDEGGPWAWAIILGAPLVPLAFVVLRR